MNLIKKIALVAMTVLMGTGVAIGVGNTLETVVDKDEFANAATDKIDRYFIGDSTEWKEGAQFDAGTGNNYGVLLNFQIKQGDQFKFKKKGTWDDQKNWYNLKGGAKEAFIEGSDNNIKALCDGYFDFYFSNQDWNIYVEYGESSRAEVYVQVKEWTDTYVYAFDETAASNGHTFMWLNAWPGTKVTSTNKTSQTNFKNDSGASLGGIAKFTIPCLSGTKIILNNNSGTQTGNQIVSNGHYYYNNAGNDAKGSLEIGLQAKLVYDIDKAIEAATDKSVCKINANVASEFVNRYDGLTSTTFINKSSINTIDDLDKTKTKGYTYDLVVISLRKVASGVYKSNILLFETPTTSENLLLIFGAGAALTIVISFVLIRKRRKYCEN